MIFHNFFTSAHYWRILFKTLERRLFIRHCNLKAFDCWKFLDIERNICCCEKSILRALRNILGVILYFELFQSFEYLLDRSATNLAGVVIIAFFVSRNTFLANRPILKSFENMDTSLDFKQSFSARVAKTQYAWINNYFRRKRQFEKLKLQIFFQH